MKKQTLLESIKRMHQIIGIQPDILLETEINENNPLATEGAKIFTKLFTGFEKALAVGGKNYTKTQVKTIIGKAGNAALTADEKAVMQILAKDIITADKALIKRMSSEIFGEMLKLPNKQLKTKYYSEVKAGLRDLLPDTEFNKIIKGVDDKLGSGKPAAPKPAAPKPAAPKQNSVLKPKPKNNIKPIVIDDLPPNADEIILNTAKSSPEAAAYMVRIDGLGFNSKITQLLKLEYSRLSDVSSSEIIKEGNALVQQLSEKDYGWLKRVWSSFTKNPSGNVKEAGKTGIQLVLWYTAIGLALTGSALVWAFKDKIEGATGVKASEALPSLPNLKSSSGEFTNDEAGITKFLTKSYPTKDINNFTINRDSDASYSVTYTENGGTSKPIIFNYRNGTFSK